MTRISESLLSLNSSIDQDDSLVIGGCRVTDLVDEFGTPLIIYDDDHIRSRMEEIHSVCGADASYACKAFLSPRIVELANEVGIGLDVATTGELQMVLSLGFDPSRITFHGNNKTAEALLLAMKVGVGKIAIDSFSEIRRIEEIHGDYPELVASALVRITPGVYVETHEYITTGHDDSKFGFNLNNGDAKKSVQACIDSEAIELVGMSIHIGSQVFDVEAFAEAITKVGEFASMFNLKHFVVGGGIGVAYVNEEETPDLKVWAEAAVDAVVSAGCEAQVGIEPGRAVVADAAVTVYTVGTIKEIAGIRTYVAIDGGMSDNPRPIVYGIGYEAFCPTAVTSERERVVTLTGHHCESGDHLIVDASIPESVGEGDLIATPVTGAYQFSMSSNYQWTPRPAILFVGSGQVRVERQRETVEQLLAEFTD